MALLDELALHIENQGLGHTRAGGNLMLGLLPDSPAKVVSLMQTGGRGPMQTQTDPLAADFPRVAVWVRAEAGHRAGGDYAAAETLADALYAAFAPQGELTLSGTRYVSLVSLQPPFLLQRDKSDRPILAFNVEAMRVRP